MTAAGADGTPDADPAGVHRTSEVVRAVQPALEAWQASGVQIPDPWDPQEFARRVGDWRGRPLHLVPASRYGWPGHLVLTGRNVDMLVYDDTVHSTALYARHGILHELGHLLLGHQGVAVDPDHPDTVALTRELADRGRYDDVEEREAEVFATLIGMAATPSVTHRVLDG